MQTIVIGTAAVVFSPLLIPMLVGLVLLALFMAFFIPEEENRYAGRT